jgi:hypothetical protein
MSAATKVRAPAAPELYAGEVWCGGRFVEERAAVRQVLEWSRRIAQGGGDGPALHDDLSNNIAGCARPSMSVVRHWLTKRRADGGVARTFADAIGAFLDGRKR